MDSAVCQTFSEPELCLAEEGCGIIDQTPGGSLSFFGGRMRGRSERRVAPVATVVCLLAACTFDSSGMPPDSRAARREAQLVEERDHSPLADRSRDVARIEGGAGDLTPCGAAGTPCCADNQCNPGSVCVANTCALCGGDGQPCCAMPAPCPQWHTCNGTTCADCGDELQTCCPGSEKCMDRFGLHCGDEGLGLCKNCCHYL
jgi:hypothetical protein